MTPPIPIRGLDHVVIRAKDVERMVAFYRDVLGCPVELVQEDIGLWQLRAGSALIDLVDVEGRIGREGGAPPGPEGHNFDHYCLEVDPWDPEAIRAHLKAHGADPGEVARRYGSKGYGPSIYLEDPEGNRLELKGPPEEPGPA